MRLPRILFVTGIWTWMAYDGWQAIANTGTASPVELVSESILWHRLGMFLVAIPFGIALLPIRYRAAKEADNASSSFAGQLMILIALLSLIVSWGMRQVPRGEVTTLILYSCPLLSIVGVGLPSVLRWIHLRRARIETSPVLNESG